MQITVDFTLPCNDRITVQQIQDMTQYLSSVVFILPFWTHLQSKFSCLCPYMNFLNDKPMIKITIIPSKQDNVANGKFNTVAVGGTFDHLHIGHQILLMYTALLAKQKVIVGVTSQSMLLKKINKELIQSAKLRIQKVQEYIQLFRPDLTLSVVQIYQPFGPAITDPNIDAIVVSEQTLKGGQAINKVRLQKEYKSLQIKISPVISREGNNKSGSVELKEDIKISSTFFRNHLLEKNGLSLEQYSQYKVEWNEMIKKLSNVFGPDISGTIQEQRWWFIVLLSYSQNWRYYHTNQHIFNMLQDLRTNFIDELAKLSQMESAILLISIFFHDVIYRPDKSDNEEESAKLAQLFLEQILLAHKGESFIQLVKKVKDMIISTKKHQSSSDILEALLIDLDMGIIDSDQNSYKKYAENVEKEYRPLVKQKYPVKRIEFLKSVQKNGFKFTWKKGQNLQQNISWQIEHLNSQLLKKQSEQQL